MMLAASFPCTPDALSHFRNPTLSSKPKFTSHQALIFLDNCTNFKQLKQIHGRVIRFGLTHDQVLSRTLIQLCSSYGQVDYAALVFHQTIHDNETFTWNVLIRAFSTNGCPEKALLLFKRMLSLGYPPPDKFTFPFAINACIASASCYPLDLGNLIHGLAVKCGFWDDLYVQNTVMNLYFKCQCAEYGCKVFEKLRVRNLVSCTTVISGLIACGQLEDALYVFDRMPSKNVVSWTAMMDGYLKTGRPEKAFELFHRMQADNVRPNKYTMVSLIRACAEMGSLKLGKWSHDYIIKSGIEIDTFLGTALIDMYSNCGSIDNARRVFGTMQDKSLATWNSMITSLGVHGFGDEALEVFTEMEKANVSPDAITFIGVLSACICINSLEKGQRYFNHMIERYGIIPILDHRECILELYRRADKLDEVYDLTKTISVKNGTEVAS